MGDLILGGDLGGSTTRIVIEHSDGSIVGEGVAAGGSPVAQPETAQASFEEALRSALGDVDPARVRGGLIGMAGSIVLRDPVRRAGFDSAWSRIGLAGRPRIVSDLEVAYASATDEDTGVVLIAGTGVSAAKIARWQVRERRGGYGWMLGDEGAGVWLGRAAVRATLAALYAGETSRLADLVLAWFELDGATHDDLWPGAGPAETLISTVNAAGAVALAALAPLVMQAHRELSPDALDIVDESARLLAATVAPLLEPRGRASASDTPIVLAGSILSESLPTGRAARELLEAEHGGNLLFAASGTRGALALARRECL